MKFHAVQVLAVRAALHTILDVSNTFAGQWMTSQISRGVVFVGSCRPLQALKKRNHAIGVKSCLLQDLEADTVSFTLEITRVS
ncbi:MAG: hypothetical protein JW384_01399 [Nitrosomonadaceae bacterium]|nr:hypothetical protein [Nitrosomonadaceae bacterium]